MELYYSNAFANETSRILVVKPRGGQAGKKGPPRHPTPVHSTLPGRTLPHPPGGGMGGRTLYSARAVV